MTGTVAAVCTALVAALLLGVSSVAQRRGMRPAGRDGDASSPGLFTSVVASPWWWLGTAASIGGLLLQFLALSIGSLIVVQTTMVSSVAATTLAERLLLGRRPGRAGWAGAALMATGLGGVLWTLSPTVSQSAVPSSGVMAALGLVGLGAVAAAAVRARLAARGGLVLAGATGLGYGITAVALKAVGAQLADGWAVPLAHPAFWVAAVLGPASVLLSQHALHRARRVAAAVGLMVVVDPLVGIVAGAAWFGERFATSPTALLLATGAAGAVMAGIGLSHSARPVAMVDDEPRRVLEDSVRR